MARYPNGDRVESAEATVHATVIRSDDASDDGVRVAWNGTIDGRPAPVARWRVVAGVVGAVRAARDHELGGRWGATSDHDDEPGALSRCSSVVDRPFPCVLALPPSVWPLTPALGGSEGAAVTIGLVLTEAVALYAGYGALARVAGPAVREVLERT